MPATEDIREKYHLSPLPQNVQRLGKLLQGGFEQNATEIASIIKSDESLTKRVIHIASNGKKRDTPLEIEAAVIRLGVSSITLVLMSELIINAVTRTYDTMLRAKMSPLDFQVELDGQMVGAITIAGKVQGKVFLRLPDNLASWLVDRFLGPDAVPDPKEIFGDVVGELLNMVGGNFKSNLVDAGLSCTLSVPSVGLEGKFVPKTDDDSQYTSMGFSVDGTPVFVDLQMKRITETL
jgi:chemotaxis protein CheX